MSGFTISELVEGLKTKVSALTRETNVYAYPVDDPKHPSITIELEPDPIDYFTTMSATGIATLRVSLLVRPGAGDGQSRYIRLYDYLSTGTGNGSSVLDALLLGATLGLTDCTAVLAPDRSVSFDNELAEARIPVDILIKKVGGGV